MNGHLGGSEGRRTVGDSALLIVGPWGSSDVEGREAQI